MIRELIRKLALKHTDLVDPNNVRIRIFLIGPQIRDGHRSRTPMLDVSLQSQLHHNDVVGSNRLLTDYLLAGPGDPAAYDIFVGREQ